MLTTSPIIVIEFPRVPQPPVRHPLTSFRPADEQGTDNPFNYSSVKEVLNDTLSNLQFKRSTGYMTGDDQEPNRTDTAPLHSAMLAKRRARVYSVQYIMSEVRVLWG